MDQETLLSEIRSALAELGALGAGDAGSGPIVEFTNGETARLLPTTRTNADAQTDTSRGEGVTVVVADQIPKTKRQALNDQRWSWLDRRGHFRFRYGHIWIEADVTPMPSLPDGLRHTSPFAGAAALGIALMALERHPEPLEGIRATARAIGVAASTAHEAITRLVDAGQLTRDLHATIPGLFWALTDHWNTSWFGLAGAPTAPRDGVVLVGNVAAAGLGAPAVTSVGYPREILAADDRSARRLIREFGTAPLNEAPARIAIAPTRYAATPGDVNVDGIEVAHPIVVALGLATDPARGAEIVNNWDLPDRVW